MREMVFRERQEKVAHLTAITRIVGQLFNLDSESVFSRVLRDYASEVFQETYDADLLRRKIEAIRRVQTRIRGERSESMRQLNRLERMGEFYDREYGPDLLPAKQPPPKPKHIKPRRPLNPIKEPG